MVTAMHDTLAAHDPTATYLHLGTGPEVTMLPATDEFWATLDDRAELHRGRLVTGFVHDADWTVWERHPVGDELIVVTSGSVRFHLDDGESVRELTVAAPEYLVVPAGMWHTADALGPARMLVVTWGEGTDHRPR
jgi:mannose-6-phosphate isomerase-like protein (cupin superfamily)